MQTTDWPRSISFRMSRGPMKPAPPITRIDMLSPFGARLGPRGPSPATACSAHRHRSAPRPAGPQPRDGLQRSPPSGDEPVVGGAVVPEDLALALFRNRQPEERLDGPR